MRILRQELTELFQYLDDVYDFLKELEVGNLDSFNIMTGAKDKKLTLRQAIAILENLGE